MTFRPDRSGIRLDMFLATVLEKPRVKAKELINNHAVLVNQRREKPSFIISTADVICVKDLPQPAKEISLQPKELPLDILHEDEDVLVVNKAPGVVVHPGNGTFEPTLIEGVCHYLEAHQSHWQSQSLRPGVVHRLDKNTSGVLVIAKNPLAHEFLAQQFRDKTNHRQYWALLDGVLPKPEVVVETLIERDPRNRVRYRALDTREQEESKQRRFAKSTFETLRVYADKLSLVRVSLSTGRTHQIRVHAKWLGVPVVGDDQYNPKLDGSHLPNSVRLGVKSIKRQMLHARTLGFCHPVTRQNVAFKAPIPEDFAKVIKYFESKST